MLAVISPAKTLDFESASPPHSPSQPEFLAEAEALVEILGGKTQLQLMDLMGISDSLAALNFQRFKDWKRPFTEDNARAALLAFKGDVYTGFNLSQYNEEDFAFAQQHLRILSGLYGVLRPLDLIQPYRLEMGTKLKTEKGKDLYQFWADTITQTLNLAVSESGSDCLVNLASNEYYHSVRENKLEARVITPVFKDQKNGSYKVISFFAKKARGMMCDYLITNRINAPTGLKDFRNAGYRFDQKLSSDTLWVFTRAETPAIDPR